MDDHSLRVISKQRPARAAERLRLRSFSYFKESLDLVEFLKRELSFNLH